MQVFVGLGLLFAVSWLWWEVWLRRAPVEALPVREIKLKSSAEGDTWFRAQVTLLSGFAPEDRWVWISKRQYEALEGNPEALPVHVQAAFGKVRLRAQHHWRRMWWIGAASLFFLVNFIASFGSAWGQ